MEKTTEQIINEQWELLPIDIKAALTNVPWKTRVRDIAKREGLDEAKSLTLETETLLILYGFLPPETFEQNILTQLNIDEEQAERITKLVSNEIVADIEKQLEMLSALAPEQEITQVARAPEKEGSTATSPSSSDKQAPGLPEIPPQTLPDVVEGQVAHDNMAQATPEAASALSTPKSIAEQKLSQITPAPAQNPSYPDGKDPYREPIE